MLFLRMPKNPNNFVIPDKNWADEELRKDIEKAHARYRKRLELIESYEPKIKKNWGKPSALSTRAYFIIANCPDVGMKPGDEITPELVGRARRSTLMEQYGVGKLSLLEIEKYLAAHGMKLKD